MEHAAEAHLPEALGGNPEADLQRILRTLKRATDGALRTELATFGLSPSEALVLAVLASGEDCTMVRLARELGITQPTVTVLIETMRQRGLVTRERDRRDGRLKRIALTPTGERARARAIDARDRVSARMLAGLDAPTINTLTRTLAAMAAALGPGERGDAGEAAMAGSDLETSETLLDAV